MWPWVVVYPPYYFQYSLHNLLKPVNQAELRIQLSSGITVEGMLFANAFICISDSKESLQKCIDVVYSYFSKWR